MQTYIYALVDPRDSRVRYVGKSNDPKKRLREHLREVETGHNRNPFFCWWIRLLNGLELKPIIRLIVRVPTEKAAEMEKPWIAAFRWAGEKITNLHEGGMGGATRIGQRHTPETKERMRAAHIARSLGLPEQGPDPAEQVDASTYCAQCREPTSNSRFCSRQCYWTSLKGTIPWNKGKTGQIMPAKSESARISQTAKMRVWWANLDKEKREAMGRKISVGRLAGKTRPRKVKASAENSG